MRFRRILWPLALIPALLWFFIDAVFFAVVRPFTRWLGAQSIMPRVRAWVSSRGRYTSLALVAVPLVLLEPVKPVAGYLVACGQWRLSVVVLVVGEVVKLVLVERTFHLCRDKVLSFAFIRWCYEHGVGWLAVLKALPPWRLARQISAEWRLGMRRWARYLREQMRQANSETVGGLCIAGSFLMASVGAMLGGMSWSRLLMLVLTGGIVILWLLGRLRTPQRRLGAASAIVIGALLNFLILLGQ